MPVFVKICGIRNLADARTALDAGAHALGFLVGLDYPSGDALEPDQARAIAAIVPAPVRRVLVTHRTSAREVTQIFRASGCDAVQLHGAFPAAEAPALRVALADAWVIGVVHVDGEGALDRAAEVAGWADAVLLDTRTAERLGGTGRTHDWSISTRIVASLARPVILAGGLRSDNVADAVTRVAPFGVDVNSGVENASGFKEPALVAAFISAAHGAPRRAGERSAASVRLRPRPAARR